MFFLAIIVLVLYVILIAWTWQNLGSVEKSQKITVIIIAIFVVYVITQIIYQTTLRGIYYPSQEIQKKVQMIFLLIFTGINGMLTMPHMGKLYELIKKDEIAKEKLTKKIIIFLIVLTVCFIFESNYIKNAQEGILKIYQT